jgi:preprotein translocase subunit SecD
LYQGGKTGIDRVELAKLAVVVLAIAGLVFLGWTPLATEMEKHLGLDLQGGVSVVYQAVPTPEAPVTPDSMKSLRDNMEKRVNALGVTEPLIQLGSGNRIIVELAGITDPEQAVEEIGRTAHMEFKTEDGKVVLTGKDLQDARAQLGPGNEPEVTLKFNDEGAKVFAEVTAANVGKTIAIYLDDQLLTNPQVKQAIPSGDAVISGGYRTLQEAQDDALLLKAGALPVQVQLIEKRTVGPTLGQESLDRSLMAGAIGLAVVFLFMALYYRVPGLVADLSLVVYCLIVAGVYLLVNATLTLPGIAAFIISVGMAVDANILIYERLKEELRAGKTLRSAFDAGFRHALRTILDCNVTTLIGAAVLYYFGTGPIKGFAVTLGIGVVISLFTAVTFTRFIMHLLVTSRLVLNPWAYGLSKPKAAAAPQTAEV